MCIIIGIISKVERKFKDWEKKIVIYIIDKFLVCFEECFKN